MIQRVGQAFRSLGRNSCCCADLFTSYSGQVACSPSWTQGATILDQLTIQTPALQSWKLLGYSISAYLTLQFGEGLPNGGYGRLGKVIGGFTSYGSQTRSPRGTFPPWVNPMLPLPPDPSMITQLWDGSADPTPPLNQPATSQTFTGPSLPVSASVMMPEPVSLDRMASLLMGIWITPSVLSDLGSGVAVYSGSYMLILDDGRPEPQSM